MTSPADMVRIADAPDNLTRRLAQMLADNLTQAEKALQSWKAPRMGAVFATDAHDYDHPADAGTVLICPWCQKPGTLICRDISYRDTVAEDVDMATEVVSFTYDETGDYETLHYLTECCELPVRLPLGWEEV